MKKLNKFALFFLISLIVYPVLVFAQATPPAETVTITTYYPSPYGSYRELRSRRMAIGDNYYNNANVCWTGGGGPACPGGSSHPDTNGAASLVVEDRVGIGTAVPVASSKVTIEGNVATNIAALLWKGTGTSAEGFLGFGTAGTYGTTGENVLMGASATSNANVIFRTNNASRMIITNAGDVGIGTVVPQAKVQILSGANNYLTLGQFGSIAGFKIAQTRDLSGNAGAYFAHDWSRNETGMASTGAVALYANGFGPLRTILYGNTAGNVGIGTQSPTSATPPAGGNTANLDVNDVWLRNVGRWASQGGGSGKVLANAVWYGATTPIPANTCTNAIRVDLYMDAFRRDDKTDALCYKVLEMKVDGTGGVDRKVYWGSTKGGDAGHSWDYLTSVGKTFYITNVTANHNVWGEIYDVGCNVVDVWAAYYSVSCQ